MTQGYEIFALLLASFLLFIGLYYLISTELETRNERKEREQIYKSEMLPFKRSGVQHTENKIPAFYRVQNTDQARQEMQQ